METADQYNDEPAVRGGLHHLRILAALPAYVTAVKLGQGLTPELQALAVHLEHCPVCRAEADELLNTMEVLYSGVTAAAPAAPAPELGFLRSPRARLGKLADAVVQAGSRALDAIVIQFSAALLPQLRPPTLARAGGPRLRYAYSVPQACDDDPNITVEVLAPDDRLDHGLVRICVELVNADPFDQAGSSVTLETAEQRLSAETDQTGLVYFNDVLLDDIACWRIIVRPRGA